MMKELDKFLRHNPVALTVRCVTDAKGDAVFLGTLTNPISKRKWARGIGNSPSEAIADTIDRYHRAIDSNVKTTA